MLYIVFEIFLGIASSSDLDNTLLPLYYRGFLPRYRLLLLLRYIVVPLKVPLPTIVIAGYIAKTRLVRLLDRVDIYRSYIGSRRSRYSRLLVLAILIAIATIKGISPVVFLLLLLYI